MNTLQKFEAKTLAQVQENTNLPEFSPGDTIKVNVKVVEGNRERVQAYEGVCIAKGGNGINTRFTVRKISYGEGVERVFPLYSPRIDSIELVRRGSVKRSKLYYLRDRRGKSARISERTTGHGIESEEELQAARASKPKKEKKEKKPKLTKEQRAERRAQRAAEKKAEKAKAKAAEAEAAAAEGAENAEDAKE